MESLNRNVVYPAIFTPEKDGSAINVSFPDVPEAITFGKDKNQALIEAQSALGLALYGYRKLPKPSRTNQINLKSGQYVILVPINLAYEFSQVKPIHVKKNTSLLLKDALKAKEAHLNCSQLLTNAIRKKYKDFKTTSKE